jgi:hypothetical protein
MKAETIIVFGILITLVGILIYLGVPFFRLPGDIVIEKENFKFYFPISTSIIVSIMLTILYIISSVIKQ